jgi:3-(3-hydroxy-phenyl)propionate hydroxylase
MSSFSTAMAHLDPSVIIGAGPPGLLVGARGGVRAFFRDRTTPLFDQTELVQNRLRRFISQLSVEYRSNPLSFDQHKNGELRAGDRATDAPVRVLSGPSARTGACRIFALLDPGKFTLLLRDSDPSSGPSFLVRAAETMRSAMPRCMNVWRIADMSGAGVEAQRSAHGYGKSRH